jgi:hypothetical protein
MYYPYFIAYMAAGFIISIVVFFWALNKGQFKDQERARFLPLEPEPEAKPVRFSKLARIETLVIFVLACSGLAATAIVLLWTLLRPR